jgi:enoyl-CoA hydratase/carnithine racemase
MNPAYRALGLFGSEYHTLTYHGRVGQDKAQHLLRDMLPVSAQQAKDIGLVDIILPGYGADLDTAIHTHVSNLISTHQTVGQWKHTLDLSPTALATARANELAEMSKDFWSPRSIRYHSRRSAFVRKFKPSKTPLRFAEHRRKDDELDEEEEDSFDQIETFEMMSKKMQEQAVQETIEQLRGQVRRASTPGTVGERERRQLEVMFSCYYNAG